jgi:hypothetical protein
MLMSFRASIVSIVRGTIFFINRDHKLNEAYSNYLDIILTATEASAGLMCACLPLTKPLVVRITRRIQRLRGVDTEHHGWTTMESRSFGTPAKPGPTDRTMTKADDYDIQLLPVNSTTTNGTNRSLQAGKAWDLEKP